MRSFRIFVVFIMCFVATACAQQKKYISYTVKKGETLKSIAKRLEIKTKDLMRLNPDVKRRPSPDTVIIIPNKNFKETVAQDTIKKSDNLIVTDSIGVVTTEELYVTHKVREGDTLYNLTRLYNVSEKQLFQLNPSLEKEGLKLGDKILITVKGFEDEVLVYRDTIIKNDLSIAMLLPFRAIEYDTLSGDEIFKRKMLANITTDLYLGANVAIDSLQKQGLNVNLKLFDTGRKDTKIDSILRATDFSLYDAIVGPLYSDELPKVANRTEVPVVFPVFSRNQSSFNFSRIIKTYPDKNVHQKELMDHVMERYQNENVLIIGDSSNVSIRKALDIQTILKEHDSIKVQHDTIQSPKIIHASNGYIPKHIIINSLRAEVGNWVILATDQSVIASDAINSLISLPQEEEEEEDDEENEDDDKKKKDKEEDDEPEMQILPEDTVIKVFAFDKSSKFDKIDNDKLAKLGFTFTSDIFVDENSPSMQLFNQQYQDKHYTYPTYYATKGFDIVYDIAMRLSSGKELKETFNEGVSFRLESKFDYSKMLYKTSSNNGVFIIEYNSDMTLKRIK